MSTEQLIQWAEAGEKGNEFSLRCLHEVMWRYHNQWDIEWEAKPSESLNDKIIRFRKAWDNSLSDLLRWIKKHPGYEKLCDASNEELLQWAEENSNDDEYNAFEMVTCEILWRQGERWWIFEDFPECLARIKKEMEK